MGTHQGITWMWGVGWLLLSPLFADAAPPARVAFEPGADVSASLDQARNRLAPSPVNHRLR